MTAIKPNALRGIEDRLAKGISLIRSIYEVVYVCDREHGPALFTTLSLGTKYLRHIHNDLCVAVGDAEPIMTAESTVEGLFRTDVILEQLNLIDVSVRAAVLNPFLLAVDEVRQEAAVEQLRTAAIILDCTIKLIENPNQT